VLATFQPLSDLLFLGLVHLCPAKHPSPFFQSPWPCRWVSLFTPPSRQVVINPINVLENFFPTLHLVRKQFLERCMPCVMRSPCLFPLLLVAFVYDKALIWISLSVRFRWVILLPPSSRVFLYLPHLTLVFVKTVTIVVSRNFCFFHTRPKQALTFFPLSIQFHFFPRLKIQLPPGSAGPRKSSLESFSVSEPPKFSHAPAPLF